MAKRKVVSNHSVHPPKPPSRFLWLLEASFVSLVIFSVLAILLILFLAVTNHNKAKEAVSSISQLFSPTQATGDYKKINSNLGFELTYNSLLQTAEAVIKSSDGQEIKKDQDTQTSASYSTVNIYKKSTNNTLDGVGSTSTYVSVVTSTQKDFLATQQKSNPGLTDQQLAEKYFEPINNSNLSYRVISSSNINLDGYIYKKIEYELIHNESVSYKTLQTDYITVQNNRPFKATLYQNAGFSEADKPSFEAVINSLRYFPVQANAQFTSFNRQVNVAQQTQSELINLALGGATAYAAAGTMSDNSDITVVAKNQPAVVRIASAYCPDFKLKLKAVEQNFSGGCSATFGSGFLLTPDGVIGTNGHVVKSNVAEVLVDSFAVCNLPVIKSYLQFLVSTGLMPKANADKTIGLVQAGDKTILRQLIGTLSDPNLDSIEFMVTKEDGSYAIQLGKQAVQFNLKDLRAFDFNDQIVAAKLVDTDFDPYDNLNGKGFKKSDVAIVKASGPNSFPYVSLGSLVGLGQGSPLTVIGYPGVADNNNLVNNDKSIASATKGNVSAIREAKGNGKKLIQSDASIAPGNSGGPAIDQNGQVVGIATYGLMGEDFSGGNYNYMRDIADLKDLLSKNNVVLPTTVGGIEKTWQEGLQNFSKAYYSAAITKFQQVKAAYPAFYLADDFIARAQSEKDSGKEATPPEIYYAIVVGVVLLLIVPAIILFIVMRHHHKRREAHEAYVENQTTPGPTTSQQTQTPTTLSTAGQPTDRPSVDMLSHAPGHQPIPATNNQPTNPQQQTLQIPANKNQPPA